LRLATLLVVLALAVPAAAEDSTEGLLELLGKVDSVGGKHVGYGGGQSRFHRLYTLLKLKEDEFLIRGLLADERPIFRAMGLVLFVDRERADAIPALRERVTDRGTIDVFPRGCVGTRTTVGGLARSLLGNANFIADYDRKLPLLSTSELLALDLDIVIRNDTGPIHEPAASDLRRAIGEKRLALDLTALRKLSPKRTDTNLVRGIGRLVRWGTFAVNEDVVAFLAKVAADDVHHDHVRLAAASGIARSTTEKARKALAPLLVCIRKAGGTDIFEEWIRKARLLDALRLKTKVEKTAAVRLGDPSAMSVMEDLAAGARYGNGYWPRWAGPAFLRIVARAERGFAVWDTRGGFPFELSRFLRMYGAELEKLIGKEQFRGVSDRLWRLRAK